MFGPESGFERDLGISVAAFDIDGYRPRDELVAVTPSQVDRQALRFALRDGATMFFFVVRNEGDHVSPDDVPAQQNYSAYVCGHGMGGAGDPRAHAGGANLYFDRASQILMPSWSRGRVGLIGDAAACPSLLAGQGCGRIFHARNVDVPGIVPLRIAYLHAVDKTMRVSHAPNHQDSLSRTGLHLRGTIAKQHSTKRSQRDRANQSWARSAFRPRTVTPSKA